MDQLKKSKYHTHITLFTIQKSIKQNFKKAYLPYNYYLTKTIAYPLISFFRPPATQKFQKYVLTFGKQLALAVKGPRSHFHLSFLQTENLNRAER